MRVRPAAVAGRFYPESARVLAADVDAHLHAPAPTEPAPAHGLRALVAPHAGYVYSGPTAGVGYRLLPALGTTLRRVVLAGPAHYVAVRGVALSSADAWQTPLGRVPIDTAARDLVLARAREVAGIAVAIDDEAHAPEHSLEVQLPFLQRTLPDVPVLPMLVGDSDSHAVADLLAPWWDDAATLLVVSSDLSHYEPVDVARRLDARTAHAIELADADDLGDRDACGARPLRGVLRLARRHRARVRVLDLRTSADTAGDPYRVVGYGAFAMEA